MMGQSLAGAAVSGKFATNLSEESRAALESGDLGKLFEINRARFGGLQMKADDDAADDDDTSDEDDDDADDDADDDEDDEDDDEPSEADKRIQELSAEAKKKRLRIRELKAANKKLQEELDAAKKGKKTDDSDDTEDESTGQLKKDFETMLSANEQLRIQLAFVSNTKHQWKDPEAALKLADLSDVEIDDDGQVEGLDEALEELAKSKPYLLAESKSEDDDEDDEDGDDKRKRRRKVGQPTGGRKKGNPNRDSLVKKYPALNR